jgi:transcriptional regulator with XRE-family HTH domain
VNRERETEVVHLGRRIRRRRRGLGLTLKEVEARSGVSPALVCEVERGRVAPTLRSLSKIAGALEVGLADLLGEPGRRPAVTVGRTAARRTFSLGDGAALFEVLLGAQSPFDVSLHIIRLGPHSCLSEPTCRFGVAEEFATVIEGRLAVQVGPREVVLEEGDAIHFRGGTPHSFSNPSEKPARALWITHPRVRW